jgi:anti-sigma-K factor RskA
VEVRLPHSERRDELVAVAALDALDGADRDEFERHVLSGCARCEQARAAWRRDLTLLARATTPAAPDAEVAARLRGAIAAAENSPGAARRRPAVTAWLAVAASLALVAVGTDDLMRRRALTGAERENAQLAERRRHAEASLAEKTLRARFLEDPDVQAILLTGMGPQPGARGKVIYSPKARRALFVSAGLEPLATDRQYELWFLAAGKPIAAGTFDARPGVAAVFESEPLPAGVAAVEKFAVTIEPRGGVPQPTGPMVLAGAA